MHNMQQMEGTVIFDGSFAARKPNQDAARKFPMISYDINNFKHHANNNLSFQRVKPLIRPLPIPCFKLKA